MFWLRNKKIEFSLSTLNLSPAFTHIIYLCLQIRVGNFSTKPYWECRRGSKETSQLDGSFEHPKHMFEFRTSDKSGYH